MLIILGSVGCVAAILTTTWALAEVLTSPTLAPPKRWSWVLALLAFSIFAAIAWYTSKARSHHAPVNLFEDAETIVSRIEIDRLIEEIDAHRQASTK